ncbi:MAG: hypothetical protein JXA44_07175 [Methanospirillaceae archaeon]|nr:hypothetical protein [Methanospirillaceae archaeon]
MAPALSPDTIVQILQNSLVDFAPGADLLNLSGLKLYFEDIFGRLVDVVPGWAIRKEFRETILADPIDI